MYFNYSKGVCTSLIQIQMVAIDSLAVLFISKHVVSLYGVTKHEVIRRVGSDSKRLVES